MEFKISTVAISGVRKTRPLFLLKCKGGGQVYQISFKLTPLIVSLRHIRMNKYIIWPILSKL